MATMQSSALAFRNGMVRVSQSVFTARNGLIALGAASGLLLATRNAIRFADEIAKTSAKVGLTAEALQELRFAADQSGVELSELDTSLRFFVRSQGEAIQGTQLYIDAFNRLGVTTEEIKRLSPEELLNRVADGFTRIKTPAEQAAAAQEIFGRSGIAMVNLLRNGSEEMDALRQRARELGIVLSSDVTKRAEVANDRLDEMVKVLQVGGASLALEFMPPLQALAETITDPNFIRSTREFSTNIAAAIRFLADHSDLLVRVTGALAGIALLGRAGPWGALAGGIAGAFSPEIVDLFTDSVSDAEEAVADLNKRIEDQEKLIGLIKESPDLGSRFGQMHLENAEKELEDLIANRNKAIDRLEEAQLQLSEALKLPERGGAPGLELPDIIGDGVTDQADAAVSALDKFKAKIQDLKNEAATLQRGMLDGSVTFDQYNESIVAAAEALRDAGLISAYQDLDNASAEAKAAALEFIEAHKRVSALRDAQRIIEETRTTTERYQQAIIRLNQLFKEGYLTADQYNRGIRAAQDDFRAATEAAKELDATSSDLNETVEFGSRLGRELGLTFTSSFEEALVAGGKFQDLLKGIEQDLIRLAARMFVTEPLLQGASFLGSQLAQGFLANFGGGGSTPVVGQGGSPTPLFGGGPPGSVGGASGAEQLATGGIFQRTGEPTVAMAAGGIYTPAARAPTPAARAQAPAAAAPTLPTTPMAAGGVLQRTGEPTLAEPITVPMAKGGIFQRLAPALPPTPASRRIIAMASGGIFQRVSVPEPVAPPIPLFRAAQGAVFHRPMTMPALGGNVKMAEAAQPEAVMPLASVGGKLGVNAAGIMPKVVVLVEPQINLIGAPKDTKVERRGESIDIILDQAMAGVVHSGNRFNQALSTKFKLNERVRRT